MSVYNVDLDADHPLTPSHHLTISLLKQVPVFLILQEQISRALFRHFRLVGMTGCIYENALDQLLLASINRGDGKSTTHQLYNRLMTKWAVHSKDDDRSMIRKALKVYGGLIKARREQEPFKQRNIRQITFSIVLNDKRPLVQTEKVKISHSMQVPVFLIRYELQIRALFEHLHLISQDGWTYEPTVDRLILACVDLRDGSDETFSFYTKIMERNALKTGDDDDLITKKALAVYRALMKRAAHR